MSTTVIRPVTQKYIRKDGTVGETTSIQTYEPKRPRRTDDEIREILNKRKEGATIDTLCKEYKMARNTFYSYMRRMSDE